MRGRLNLHASISGVRPLPPLSYQSLLGSAPRRSSPRTVSLSLEVASIVELSSKVVTMGREELIMSGQTWIIN